MIMLASLKTGGTGLNLTMASRVLLVEPWWNSCIEQQAFCRVYRRGQTKETELTRVIIKDSIDEKLLALQQKKEGEISSVMKGEWTSRLSLTDLMSFLGQVDTDENGRPFIVTENKTPNLSEHVMVTENNEVVLMEQDSFASLRETTPA